MSNESFEDENESFYYEDDEEQSEEEWEEPKLNYLRMRNDLLDILKDDYASCITMHSKFVALGTHLGAIHVLDHEGNRVRDQEFAHHSASVTGITLDGAGEFVASCSDDGLVVVSGLYTEDQNQIIKVDRPVKVSVLIKTQFINS